ncbi:MAG: Ig-like domain-containing protein, partial [Nitrospirota bacterium]
YFYKVCTVMQNGAKSCPTKSVGIVAGTNQPYTPPAIQSFTSDASGKVTYAGEVAFFNLSGTPGDKAVFSIERQAGNITRAGRKIPMKEITPGIYRGACRVARGARIINGYATATLSDENGGQAFAKTDANLDFIGKRKPALPRLHASRLKSDMVCINWPRSDSGAGYYNLYRDTSRIVDTGNLTPLSSNISPGVSTYIDDAVKAGSEYYYVLVYADPSGAVTAISDNLKVKIPRMRFVFGKNSVEEDSGGKTLKPGDVLGVTVNTAPGGKAVFSIRNAARNIALTEDQPGVYKGTWTIKEGEGIFKTRVAISFTAADGSKHAARSATLVSVDAPKVKPGRSIIQTASVKPSKGKKPVATGIEDDIKTVLGPSGRLTAGKTFTVTMKGDPGNRAWFLIGGMPHKIPMKQEAPGIYKGSYTIKPRDNAGTPANRLQPVYLAGYLKAPGGAVSDPVKSPESVIVDTSCNISVQPSVSSIPADGKSRTRIAVTVTDADGQPVKGRRLALMLQPQSAQKAANLGRLKAEFKNLTDSQGKMTAIYVSGTAAKTATVVVRDNSTGSVGQALIATEGVILNQPVLPRGRKNGSPGGLRAPKRGVGGSFQSRGIIGLR